MMFIERLLFLGMFAVPFVYSFITGWAGAIGVVLGVFVSTVIFVQFGSFIEMIMAIFGINYGKFTRENQERRQIQKERKEARKKFKIKFEE